MRVLAHRGHHRDAAENSLEAFEAAVALGVDGIETDVRLTADGVLVLHHDRTLPGGAPVAGLSRAALEHALGRRVATLEDALSTWDGIAWDIEIKTPEAGCAAADVIARYAERRELIVSSFRHPVLREVFAGLPVALGFLTAGRLLDESTYLARSVARHDRKGMLICDHEVLDAELAYTARELGVALMTYGAASRAECEEGHDWPHQLIYTIETTNN